MHHVPTHIRCSSFPTPAHVYCRHCGSSELEELGLVFTSARKNFTASEFGVDVDVDDPELSEFDVHYGTYAPTAYGCLGCDERSDDLYALIAARAWRRGDRARSHHGQELTVEDVRADEAAFGGGSLKLGGDWVEAGHWEPCALPSRGQLQVSIESLGEPPIEPNHASSEGVAGLECALPTE